MIKRTLIVFLCTFGLGLTACGDDIGDKQANELTAEERTQVCEESNDYFDSKISEEDTEYASCVLAGELAASFDTTGMTTCESARDACLEEPDEEPTEEESNNCSNTAATDCTATVDEIRNCNEAQIDASAEYFSQIECGAEVMASEGLPSECDVVVEKCPDFFESDDTQNEM